jgi:hypothetical protein
MMTNEELIKKYCNDNDLNNMIKLHNNINITKNTITDNEEEYNVFEWLCINEKIDIIKWLNTMLDYNDNKNVINYQNGFIESCKKNKLNMSQWLYNNKKNIELNYNVSFIICAHLGNIEMCKWLYSLGEKIDIDNISFNYACVEGHIELLKWMYLLPNNTINIHEDYEYPFVSACYNGRLDICQWLYSLDQKNQIDIHVNNDMPMFNAKLSGNQELIDWLQNLG